MPLLHEVGVKEVETIDFDDFFITHATQYYSWSLTYASKRAFRRRRHLQEDNCNRRPMPDLGLNLTY